MRPAKGPAERSAGPFAFELHAARAADLPEVARLFRQVWTTALPFLPVLYTPAEDLAFFQGVVFPTCTVTLALGEDRPIGFCAFKPGWIDHLYVLPAWHGNGVGTALLRHAQAASPELRLYAFQRNQRARAFYAGQGFIELERSDGSDNEEREPDVLLLWQRPEAGLCGPQS